MVVGVDKCPCGGDALRRCRRRDEKVQLTWEWECKQGGHKSGDIHEALRGIGILERVTVANWAAGFHIITLLRCNQRWGLLEREMKDAYGIDNHDTLLTSSSPIAHEKTSGGQVTRGEVHDECLQTPVQHEPQRPSAQQAPS